MSEIAKIELGGQSYELPVIEGSEQEKGVDIGKLRGATGGYITLDSGFKNTGSCKSAITYLDGENGIIGKWSDLSTLINHRAQYITIKVSL